MTYGEFDELIIIIIISRNFSNEWNCLQSGQECGRGLCSRMNWNGKRLQVVLVVALFMLH